MPTYEMPLLLRIMNKPETFNALKRTATAIFDKGGIIRKIENLGLKKLPCKLSFRGRTYWEANHFLYYFDVPPLILPDLIDEYNRDIDILRTKIYKKNSIEPIECTLHEELLPPVYRKNVIQLMEVAEIQKKKHKKLQYDREMKYYPSKPNQVS
ncbi:probable 28S ribosomal protein S6, mitochondrial [Vespa mandarinia]|uniref:probable 28S ribosomal protein S6, mitochondrial n=1 Tax=Vespa mandarinia TaxID=7446 RepID=UPI0016097606|nr:probable 28S ribosomal protein S6, mitochondrial [Vespa mandarinia]